MKHHPQGWGDLNVALNRLVQTHVIAAYKTDSDEDGQVSIQVVVLSGADQAEVVQQVRAALPEAFSEAKVRTVRAR